MNMFFLFFSLFRLFLSIRGVSYRKLKKKKEKEEEEEDDDEILEKFHLYSVNCQAKLCRH